MADGDDGGARPSENVSIKKVLDPRRTRKVSRLVTTVAEASAANSEAQMLNAALQRRADCVTVWIGRALALNISRPSWGSAAVVANPGGVLNCWSIVFMSMSPVIVGKNLWHPVALGMQYGSCHSEWIAFTMPNRIVVLVPMEFGGDKNR